MAQIADHRDLLTSYRPGDLQASERIVRLYQNELLRSAYLLTASADGAVLLARDAFLDFFRRLMRGDVPDDPRYGLLQSLGRDYLTEPDENEGDNGDRPSSALAGTVSFEADRQRYRVGDERSRVLESLDLLDRETRLGLVLRDFNALDEEPVCQILDETPFALRDRLHPARNRLVDSAGAAHGASVRELLVNAATAAPRPNLWPEVAGPLEGVFAEEDERRQRYTYAAAGAVALLLFFAGLWLFDVFPFGGGDDGQAAAAPTATPTATPEPTVTPTPVPELSSFAIPRGDVPGELLMRLTSAQGGEQATEFGFFDIESESYSAFVGDSLPRPSPDGRFLVGITGNEDGTEDAPLLLVAFDSQTGERVWESELPQGVFTVAMTGDRVYVVTQIMDIANGEETDLPELREYDLETGDQTASWPELIPSMQTTTSDFIRISLHAAPDGSRLFVVLEEFGSGPTSDVARTIASYSLPDMALEDSAVMSETAAGSQFQTDFSFFNAYVTPDGAYLYNVSGDEDTVKFRASNTDEDRDLSLSFTKERSANEFLRWVTSNDGRYVYIVAPERGEAAIVDLLARREVRSFPLAFAEDVAPLQERFAFELPLGGGFGNGLTLSHDGRFLYMAGSVSEDVAPGFVDQSMLWTIDLSTGIVVRGQEVPGRILTLSGLSDRLIILAEHFETTNGNTSRLLALDPESGEPVTEFDGEGLPDWVQNFYAVSLPDYYRFTYARAAAVDSAAFSDVEIESTLPRMAVLSSSDEIPAGSSVDLAARILNPSDGQQMTEALPDVRFDLGSTVVIRLIHGLGAAEEIVLIANPSEPGEYRASSTLLETGFWNAEVTITGEDGASWSYSASQVFQVVPSWEASDGKRYILRLETDPAEPVIDEEAILVVRFVEANSGEPLPEDARIVDEFPEELRARFTSEMNGQASATLTRTDEGVYEGERSFWAAGVWEARVEVRFDDGEQVEVGAGSVDVDS